MDETSEKTDGRFKTWNKGKQGLTPHRKSPRGGYTNYFPIIFPVKLVYQLLTVDRRTLWMEFST